MPGAPTSSSGSSTSPSTRRYRAAGLNVYPHPYFDPSSWYIPPTVKEMFRWCQFLFFTNSTIGPIIRKKAAYVITDLIYGTTNVRDREIWKKLLEKSLKIKEFEFKMLLDLAVYGNSYCSVIYPFERYLVCPHCQFENLLKNIQWQYDVTGFIGECKACRSRTHMQEKDKPIRNRSRIRLHRWYPTYIDIRRNPTTGSSTYILRPPKWLKQRLKDPKTNRVFVEDTPKEILKAIRENKNVEFDPDNIYHMKEESISHEDDSFGMPQILNVIKDTWLHQTYKRAQEAIALEHVLPMTMLSPTPGAGDSPPHLNVDLGSWQSRIQNMITNWRRDQNGIFTMPFPVQVSQIRGDAQALSLHNDINQVRQQIAGGLDVPPDFIYGGLTWSGASVTLRVLENLLIGKLSALNSFMEDWLLPRLRRFLRLSPIKIYHSDFKMADDVQQKQIALGLRQTNTISDQTTVEELGFDYSKEEHRKKKEGAKRMDQMENQQIAQAQIQKRMIVIQAQGQAEANEIMQKSQMKLQSEMGMMAPQIDPAQVQQQAPQRAQGPMNVLPGGSTTATVGQAGDQMPPEMLDMAAESFMKTTPPNEVEGTLNILQQTNPMLARAVKQRMTMIQKQTKEIQALPEQKPPTRSPGKAVI